MGRGCHRGQLACDRSCLTVSHTVVIPSPVNLALTRYSAMSSGMCTRSLLLFHPFHAIMSHQHCSSQTVTQVDIIPTRDGSY